MATKILSGDHLRKFKVLCARVFDTLAPETNVRNGLKYVRGRLKGPVFLDYYPDDVAPQYLKVLKEMKSKGLPEIPLSQTTNEEAKVYDHIDYSVELLNDRHKALIKGDYKLDPVLLSMPAPPRVEAKMERAQALKLRGRGAPKKGQGKRANIKSKK